MMMPQLTHTVMDLLESLAPLREEGHSIALVPTMGALHDGHKALMEVAKQLADKVVVSIFINPKQFNAEDDLRNYPVSPEADIELMESAGVDIAWLPQPRDIYPEGFATTIRVAGVSDGLCGAYRPGHFDGVCTVVAKLLGTVLPDMAIFGEKDYQQLCVVRRMVADLMIPVEIMGVETIREADGLAYSSRNRHLTQDERDIAPALHRVLDETSHKIQQGSPVGRALEEGKAALSKAGFTTIEYLELREEDSLQPLASLEPGVPARLLAAAYLGKTRLIDNVALGETADA
jgi:pantoate--beta-alanine ligase